MFKPVSWMASLLLAAALAGCASTAAPPQSVYDELPMYGGQDRQSIPALKAADETLILDSMREYGSRDAASEQFAAQGFRFYREDDLPNAMRRFNQAWLLNPANARVYWGYASVLNDRNRYCPARAQIERALELGAASPHALADGGRLNTLCATQERGLPADMKKSYLARAAGLYTRALRDAPHSDYVYGSRATAAYWTGDYAAAWRDVKQQRALGGAPGTHFLELLRGKMAEPAD